MYFHHKSVFWPIVLIIVGVLAVLTNIGIVDVTIWEWWPILLVAFGLYILIWQHRRKSIVKSMMWYGVIHRLMKNEKIERFLENEKLQKEIGKIGSIVEGAISTQISKLAKKYGKKK